MWNSTDRRLVWYPMRALTILVGACAIGALAACDVQIKDGDVSVSHVHGRATQEWTRTYPLAPGGRVEVSNPNGSIEVAVGPAGTVDVSAAITARGMSDERAKRALNGAQIEETATPDHVRVATARWGGSLEFSYKLTVPADARVELSGNSGTVKVDGVAGHVKVMVVNGSTDLTGIRGTVDAASVNGPLTVKMADVTGRVRLEGTNGRISLEVPKDAKATLTARSINGGLTVTGLTTQETTGRRIRNLESVLNGGGPEIDVRITNGMITITGIERP
jgi:hypothetical protein